jgi:hypothetical protein
LAVTIAPRTLPRLLTTQFVDANGICISIPHATPTAIANRPNTTTIKLLTKEVYANTKSFHSVLGGGLNGHLGLAMAAAPYQLRTGALFIKPPHPGAQPAHRPNATQAQIAAANRAYDQAMIDFNTCQAIKESVKQQI